MPDYWGVYAVVVLAMRVTVRLETGAASEAEEDLQAEVVAHVKSLIRFPGMADFQYVSCDTRPLQEQVHKLRCHLHSIRICY